MKFYSVENVTAGQSRSISHQSLSKPLTCHGDGKAEEFWLDKFEQTSPVTSLDEERFNQLCSIFPLDTRSSNGRYDSEVFGSAVKGAQWKVLEQLGEGWKTSIGEGGFSASRQEGALLNKIEYQVAGNQRRIFLVEKGELGLQQHIESRNGTIRERLDYMVAGESGPVYADFGGE